MTDKRERLREELTPQEVAEYAVWYARKVKGPADKVAAALLEEFPWLREPLEAAALAHDLPMGIRGGDDDEDQYAALAVDRPSGSGLKEAVKHFLEAWPNIVNHPRYDNVEVAALRAALSGSSDPEPTMAGYASKKDAWEDGYDAGVMHGRYLASSDHTFVRDAAARPETPA